MPRRANAASEAATAAFETVKSNIQARMDVLGVTAYKVSVYTGHNQTWISDAFRRSAWVSLAWLVDVGTALNVPPRHLLMPTDTFKPGSYSPPPWLVERDPAKWSSWLAS